jgi:hypothetical protein
MFTGFSATENKYLKQVFKTSKQTRGPLARLLGKQKPNLPHHMQWQRYKKVPFCLKMVYTDIRLKGDVYGKIQKLNQYD